MFMRTTLLLSALLATSASAQITAFGNLGTGTTTWSGTVTMTGDVTIPVGGTLVIQPGTVVTANATDSQGSGDLTTKPEILVLGVLNVSGVNGGGVTFTGAGTGTQAWGGIAVRAGGAATISYATFDEMNGGIKASLGAGTTDLTISNTTISGSDYGVRTNGSGAGTLTTTLTGVSISGSAVRGFEHAAGAANLTDVAIAGGSWGIYQSGGTLSATTTRVTNNTYGVYVVGGTSSSFDRCTVAYNSSTSYAGIETSVSSGTTTVTSSIITNNGSYGVSRSSSGTLNVNASNIWGNSGTGGAVPTANANVAGYNYYNLSSVTNSKSENPLYVDAANRNYRLGSRSGSRNSGVSNVDQGALPYTSDATPGLHGTLWNDTTLSGANAVLGDLTIAPGVTLSLSPGATLTWPTSDSIGGGNTAAKGELIVLGTLTAIGVSGSPITLTSSGTGTQAWGGVVVRAGGTATIANAALDEMNGGIAATLGSVATNLTISNSTISGSDYGVRTNGSGGGTLTTTLTGVSINGSSVRGFEHAAGAANLTDVAIAGGSWGIYQSGGTLSATTTRVTNNTYGVYVVGGTSSSFDRCTVAYNSSTSYAGIETSVSSGTTTVTSSIITNNGSYGVSRSSSGTLNVNASNIWGNSGTGGAVPTANANVAGYNYYNLSSVTNSKSENPLYVDATNRNYRLGSRSGSRNSGVSSVDQGALPYVSDTTPGLHGTLWIDTTLSGANSVLGDLTVAPGVTLTLNPGATLTWPTSDSVGGGNTAAKGELIVLGTVSAIGVSGSPITLTSSGTGTQAWGGVVVRAGGTASFANAAFDKMNGGIAATLGSGVTGLTITNSTISGSDYGVRTNGSGGGTLTTTLTGVSISGSAVRGVENAAGDLTMQASSITGGSWGVYQSGGTIRLERTLVSNNTYGVYIVGGTSSQLDRCTIAYNSSTSYAGVETSVSSGTTTIVSSIITNNGSYGVSRSSSGTLTVSYTDIWGNSGTAGPPPTANANVPGYNYYNLSSVTNSNSENPLYADPSTRNYTLQSTSPSRGRGQSGVDQGAFPYTVGAVSMVTVTPTTATVAAGGVVGFSAQARDSMGNIVSNEPFTWSAASAAGTITASGVLTATCTPGTYTASITARSTNGTTGTATVVVNIGAPSQVVISPANAMVKSQATQQYSAVVRDSCNNTISGPTITWGSNSMAGTITSGGLFTASCQRGSYTGGITATAGSLTSNTNVSVIAGDPAAIAITPMTVSVPAGTTQQFAASVADGCGNTVTAGVTWSTSVTGGLINSTGLFTAGQNNGTFANGVTATAGTRTASAAVTVTGGSGGTVASVSIAPLTASLLPGASQTFVATARDSGGAVITGMPVTWAASSGGTVNSSGVFTAGNTAGTYTDAVSATVGGVTGRASVTVNAGAVATVTVAPTTVTLAPSGTATFTATARDAFNNTVTGTITWSASAAAGTITSGGVFTAGTSAGTYSAAVTATMGSVSGTATVTIQMGALSQLIMMPTAAQLQAGGTAAFSASGRDSGGATVPVTPTWSVVAGGGTITSSGVFTAGTTAGTFPNTVRAEANGLTAFASVSVTPGPVLSVAVTPSTATVMANGTQQFTAEARDAFNNVVPTGFTWTAQGAAGTITQGGFFTAAASPGAFPNSVTAAVGSVTGFASVTITPSGMGGGGGATGGGGGAMGGGMGGGGGATGGGGGGDMDAGMGGGTGGGGGSDMDAGMGGGTGGGTAMGGGTGGGTATGGGTGTGGGGMGNISGQSGCSCNTVDGSYAMLALGLLAFARRRRS